jgi:cytochrome oxidase Cu insertion factor (SCO1/SenC/PrrC family)
MLHLRFCISVLFALGTLSLWAQTSAKEDALSAAGRKYFTDVKLLTQDGTPVSLYSDLLKGKTVVINAFFGSCTDSCPKMGATLEALQSRLGDHLGKDVFLLSFSVDPENDTPEKLKAWGERFHAQPGWLFLTGEPKNVDVALSKLGQKVARREDHNTLFMIGNERTGLWTKILPSAGADSVMSVVSCILSDNKDNCIREKK